MFYYFITSSLEHDFPSLLLLGNKGDLDNFREVSKEEGQTLADRLNCDFYEMSAREGWSSRNSGVKNVFIPPKASPAIARRRHASSRSTEKREELKDVPQFRVDAPLDANDITLTAPRRGRTRRSNSIATIFLNVRPSSNFSDDGDPDRNGLNMKSSKGFKSSARKAIMKISDYKNTDSPPRSTGLKRRKSLIGLTMPRSPKLPIGNRRNVPKLSIEEEDTELMNNSTPLVRSHSGMSLNKLSDDEADSHRTPSLVGKRGDNAYPETELTSNEVQKATLSGGDNTGQGCENEPSSPNFAFPQPFIKMLQRLVLATQHRKVRTRSPSPSNFLRLGLRRMSTRGALMS